MIANRRKNSQAARRVFPAIALAVLLLISLFPVVPRTAARSSKDIATLTSVAARSVITKATAQADDAAMVKEVSARLIAVATPIRGYLWPPKAYIPTPQQMEEFGMTPDTINAFAYFEGRQPMMAFTTALLEQIVEGDENRLALIGGHELSHLLLKHPAPKPARDRTTTLAAAFSRDDEIEADLKGIELALKAGYGYRPALKSFQRFIDLKMNYNSFHGLKASHPSWFERLSLLDKEQAKLWKAMSAFSNGSFFLAIEQYRTAEDSFERVTADFPKAYDAWNNLGYARLMQYADALEAEDLRKMDVGHILVGAFYDRPESFPPPKAVNREQWEAAVAALNKALELKPDLTLAKANLGVAYLLHPDGKDAAKASQLLNEAYAALVKGDKSVNDAATLAVVVNAAVADMARGDSKSAATRLAFAEKNGQNDPAVLAAVKYNRARLSFSTATAAEKKEALKNIEMFLDLESPESAWWDLGYDRYAQLAQEQGVAVKEKEARRAENEQNFVQTVVSVSFGKKVVTLADSLETVTEKLGAAQAIPQMPGTKLVRLRYPQHGADILSTREVIAIFLRGLQSPSVEVRPAGLSARPRQLRVGMTEAQVQRLLGGDFFETPIDDPVMQYQFYHQIGVAVRYGGPRKLVQEVVVTQVAVE